MFDSLEFLTAALAKAGSKAELARILDLAPARINEYWNPPGKNRRKLSMEEGVKLCEALDLPPLCPVTEEQLIPVLEVLLPFAPKGDWTGRDVQRLAQEIVIGLRLQERLSSMPQRRSNL